MKLSGLLTILYCAAPGAVLAQSDASLGLGANTVRYSGGSSTSGSISPAFRLATSDAFLDVSGIVSTSQGTWSNVGRGLVWAATPGFLGGFHLAAEGSASGTTHTGGPWTAAVHGLGELFWTGAGGGFGLAAGSSTGWIRDQASVSAFHARGRIWWRLAGADWSVSAEPTHFYGEWFTDAAAGVSVERGPLVASLWGLARFSEAYTNRTAVSAGLQWYLTPILALELGGGSYLPDPYQGLSGAKYVSAGLRLHAVRRPRRIPVAPRENPLVPAWQGDSVLLHFRMPGATSVAVAGDWDGWTRRPLRATGPDGWTGALALTPGLYHFVLLVDGKEWVVPGGVARVPDGMGGFAALLQVPERVRSEK